MRRAAGLLLLLACAACAPRQDPTALLGPAPQSGAPLGGPGVDLQFGRKGDFYAAVLNVWVEDAGQSDILTLRSYDANAWSYAVNPYSCYLVACPCDSSCGPAVSAELGAYWPRFWPKSNYGALVDAASHATSSYSSDTTVTVHWDWKDRNGAVVPDGTYTLWVEISSYVYGGLAGQAPQAHVVVVKNGASGSALGTVDQVPTVLQSIRADWAP